MSLEATMLVLDNSAYSLNGDYAPTRLAAQADAVHILFNSKLNANPENEVGLMVMAGKSPEVLVTLTQDEGKLISALHNTKQGGVSDLSTGIQVAQLALKHRQNKNQRQRIIVFVGSPLTANTAALVKLGKKMKKNNVAIDIISFGSELDAMPPLPSSSSSEPVEPETNETKLKALQEAVNSSDNSNYVFIEPGPHLLSDRIAASPIMRRGGGDEDDSGFGSGGGGGGGADDYGVDPNLDPELAMALRMSLEEERARQAAAASAATASTSTLPSVPEASAEQSAIPVAATAKEEVKEEKKEATESTPLLSEDVGMDADEDEDLARALALSKGDDVDMEDDEDEDAAMQRALALSMKEAEENEK
ncbi:hypothetical protein T439DRAFT_329682 [Meredithblackwellia eburnea MCA 4105]